MKVVLLAGGAGTRLMEETQTRPKPMVTIGGKPILWHIMKGYAAQGYTEFIVCLGHLGFVVKEFFANYFLHTSDVTFDLSCNQMEVHRNAAEPWKVTLVDTGLESMTGGRLKRIRSYLDDRPFHFTYGDGLGDVDLKGLVRFHEASGRLATVTAVRAPGRFGALRLDSERVGAFEEKPLGDGAWINGGFFVLRPEVLDRIEGDATVWEKGPMEGLARDGELGAFKHEGFWQPMDTLRDRRKLEEHWASGRAPWKTW